MIREFALEVNEGDRSPFWKSVFKKIETKTTQLCRNRKRMVVARSWGEGEVTVLMGTDFQFGKMKTLWRWMLVMFAQQSECI